MCDNVRWNFVVLAANSFSGPSQWVNFQHGLKNAWILMLGQNDYSKDMKISGDDTRDRYVILAFQHPTTFGLSTASSAVSRASHFYCPQNQQFPLSWFQDTMVGQLTLIIIYMYMYLEYPIPVQKNRDNVCANHWI